MHQQGEEEAGAAGGGSSGPDDPRLTANVHPTFVPAKLGWPLLRLKKEHPFMNLPLDKRNKKEVYVLVCPDKTYHGYFMLAAVFVGLYYDNADAPSMNRSYAEACLLTKEFVDVINQSGNNTFLTGELIICYYQLDDGTEAETWACNWADVTTIIEMMPPPIIMKSTDWQREALFAFASRTSDPGTSDPGTSDPAGPGNELLKKVELLERELRSVKADAERDSADAEAIRIRAQRDIAAAETNAKLDIAAARREKLSTKNRLIAQHNIEKEQLKQEAANADKAAKAEACKKDKEIKELHAKMESMLKTVERQEAKTERQEAKIERQEAEEKLLIEERQKNKAATKAEQRKTREAQKQCEAQKEKIEALEEEIEALKKMKERRPTAPSALECVLCMEMPPTSAHANCGHLIYCDICAIEMNENMECPVCRKSFVQEEVKHLLKIYDP